MSQPPPTPDPDTGARVSASLLRGAAWIGIARIIVSILGAISTLALARLLMPDDFGLVAIALTVIALLSVVSDLSVGNALIQADDLTEDHYHAAFTLGLLRSVILAVVVAAVAVPMSRIYDDPRLTNIMLVLAVTCFVSGLHNPKMADFARALKFGPSQFIGVAQKLAGFVVCITLAIIYRSYWALVLGSVAAQIVQVAVGYALIRYRPRVSLRRAKSILNFSIWLTLGAWVQTLSWRSDPLVLGYFVPTAALGQYTMSNRVTNLVTQELTSPVALVLFPAFSRMKHEGHRLRHAYTKAVAILASLSLPVAIGLAVSAELAVPLVLGAKWAPAIPYFQILGVCAAIKSIQHVQPIAMATGHTQGLFGREVRAFCIRAPLLVAGIYIGLHTSIGVLMGALIGRLVAIVFNSFWNMTLIARISDVTLGHQMRAVWRPVLASTVMALLVLGAEARMTDIGLSSWLTLLSTVVLGGVAYAVIMAGSWLAAGRPAGLESTVWELSRGLPMRLRRLRAS